MKRLIFVGLVGAMMMASTAVAKGKTEIVSDADLLCPAVKAKKGETLNKEQKRQLNLHKKLVEIAGGGDINATNKNGQTALMYAAALNERFAVCWLVAKNADVTLRSDKGKTAADYATTPEVRELLSEDSKVREKAFINALLECGNEKIQQLLLNTGISLSKESFHDSRGHSRLCMAAAYGKLSEVKLLISLGADTKASLHAAFCNVHDDEVSPDLAAIVETLLKGGAPVNEVDEYGRTPLQVALGDSFPPSSPSETEETEYLTAVQHLLKAGARVPEDILLDAVKPHVCSENGYEKLLNLLLEAGANPKATNKNGRTALMTMGYRSAKVAERLIKAGVDVNAKEVGERSALSYAIGYYKAQIADLLVQKGAKISAEDLTSFCRGSSDGDPEACLHIARMLISAGQNPLQALLDDGEFANVSNPAITAFLAAGVDVSARGRGGKTLLMQKWSAGFVDELIRAGADVNAQDNDGMTPLMHIVMNMKPAYLNRTPEDCQRAINSLVRAGAKTDIRNKAGKTVLELAQEKKNEAIITQLKTISDQHTQS